MNTGNQTKINLLLQSQPQGVVFTSSWMVKNGYSLDLQRQYKKSNWFKSIGAGAMVRTGDQLTIEGAVYSLQKQLGLRVHIGGKSALGIHGKAGVRFVQRSIDSILEIYSISNISWKLKGFLKRYYLVGSHMN